MGLDFFPMLVIGALVLISVLRRAAPVVGALLGLGLGVGVTVWGLLLYRGGNAVGLLSLELPLLGFVALMAVWMVLEGLNLQRALRARKR